MRILDITPITDSAQIPIKKGTLQFLQDSHKETVANLIIGIIGSSYSTSKVYRLYGAELTNTGGDAYTNTAGAVFYNGEVYVVDAIGGGGTNMPDGIDMEVYTTQYTTDADPVTFSDATTHNVHNIRKMRYKNNASPVLGQPVDTRLITKFKGSTISSTLTVNFTGEYYYRLNSGGGTISLIFDVANAVAGASVTVYIADDAPGNLINLVPPMGYSLDAVGFPYTLASGDNCAVKITYFGGNQFFAYFMHLQFP